MRIRTIKPDFHQHEKLSELPEATHLLAAALINYADDEGYFNANPGLVKAACSPLREPSVPVPVSLQYLSNIKYLRLGTTPDGKRVGHIINFLEHQVISHAKPSKIKDDGTVWDASNNVPVIVQDTSILNRTELNRTELKGMEGGASAPTPLAEVDTEVPLDLDRTPEGTSVRMWNELAKEKNLAVVQRVTPQRRAAARARLADCTGRADPKGLIGFSVMLGKVRDSPFLTGDNDRGWRADFDFVCKAKSFTKIMEGGYDGKPTGSKRGTNTEAGDRAAIANALAPELGTGQGDSALAEQSAGAG